MTGRLQQNIDRIRRRIIFPVCAVCLLTALANAAFAQSAPIWTGSLTCQLNDQEQGAYQRQEIQTWTLTGAPRDPSQGMPVYPATWTAQAQGQLLRQQGTQATSIQWMANVPGQGGQAPTVGLAITVRASDGRLMIKQWTVSQSAPNAISGRRQMFVNGVPQGQPVTFSRALQQWQFPLIEANPTDDPVTGSMQIQADAGSAEFVHHYGGGSPMATCQWRFTRGGSGAQNSGSSGTMGGASQNSQNPNGNSGAPYNNPTGIGGGTQNSGQQGSQTSSPTSPASNPNCDSPAAVQQSFEAMKANIKSSYDALIQGTTDQAQIASLTQQEQRTLASISAQEQHDVQKAAADGCTGAGHGGTAQGTTNTPTGSASTGGGQNSTTTSTSSTPQVTPSPTNVTATAGDGSATVSWTAPTLAPGDSVAVYRISSVPTGVSMQSHSSPVTLSGLTNGTTYTFQVFAIPSQGGTPAISQPGVSNPITPVANGGVPSITSIYPTQEVCNQYRSFDLTGQNTHFAQGATVVDFGPGVEQQAINVVGQVIHTHMFIDSTSPPGLHTVRVTTGNEVVTTTFTVNAPCNPDPPTHVIATAGNASATVNWTAPNTPVASYTVQSLVVLSSSAAGTTYSSSPGPATTATTNQATVTGLANGTSYVFLVSASAGGGLTSAQAQSNPVTPTSASSGSSGSGGNGIPMATGSTHVVSMALLTGASPATNSGQQNVTVTLTGQLTNFVDGSTTVSFVRTSQPGSSARPTAAVLSNLSSSGPPPVQVVSVKVNSKTSAMVTLSMDPATAAGTYSITATTPTSSGTPEVVTLNNGFTVTTTPALTATTLTPTPATLSVAPASGSYLVTVTSLRCGRETLDDPLQRDGKGDEIYAAAFVRHYDRRSSQQLDGAEIITQIYGDAYQSTRQQAGTRSGLGGIQDSDIIPDYPSNAPVDRGNIPPKNDLFPLKLWQGTMTDGVDALVISPSIWESDGDLTLFNSWAQSQINLNQMLISAQPVQDQIKNTKFGILTLGNVSGGGVNQSTNAWEVYGVLLADAVLAIPSINLPTNGRDRPIGLAPNDTTSTALPNTTVVLTREIIEAALKGPSPIVYSYFEPKAMKIPQTIVIPKPGIMVIVFTDTAQVSGNMPVAPDGPASYAMILQVERM